MKHLIIALLLSASIPALAIDRLLNEPMSCFQVRANLIMLEKYKDEPDSEFAASRGFKKTINDYTPECKRETELLAHLDALKAEQERQRLADEALQHEAIAKADAENAIAEAAEQKRLSKLRKCCTIGMTTKQVLNSAGDMGDHLVAVKPDKINRTVVGSTVREQWVMLGGSSYLYFTNGKLTSFQD